MNDWTYILKDLDGSLLVLQKMPRPPETYCVALHNRVSFQAMPDMSLMPQTRAQYVLAETHKRFSAAFYVRAD